MKAPGLFTKIIIGLAVLFIMYLFISGNFPKFINFFKSYDNEYIESTAYFTPSFVGTYANSNFGSLPTGCTKGSSASIINCAINSKIEFYVGIANNGSKQRTFYADPCIITGYKKGAVCKEDNFLINNNNKGCRIQSGATENCRVGINFTLDKKTTYRVYPGARCSSEECPDTNNPNNLPTVNTNSFIEITVN